MTHGTKLQYLNKRTYFFFKENYLSICNFQESIEVDIASFGLKKLRGFLVLFKNAIYQKTFNILNK